MNLFLKFITSFVLLSQLTFAENLLQRIDRVKQNASKVILDEIREDKYFNMPLSMGTSYTVQYMLYSMYVGNEELFPKDWQEILKKKLLKERRADGSWRYLKDQNNDEGDLSNSIINYWGLKVLGVRDEGMERSKEYILKNGGIENAIILLKVLLSLFNNYSYKELSIPPIPQFIFSDHFFIPDAIKTKQLGQWIAPHVLPISYIKRFKVKKSFPKKFHLDELYVGEKYQRHKKINKKSYGSRFGKNRKASPRKTDHSLVKKMIDAQKLAGSYGGYVSATILTNIAYDHYLRNNPSKNLENKVISAVEKGNQFLINQHYDKDKKQHLFSGWVCDGRVWDTALLTQALVEAGSNDKRIINATKYVLGFQTKEGGFPFGLDFEDFPDHDDAAEVLLMLHAVEKKYPNTAKKEIQKVTQWLLKRQNSDGGWGAFDIDNTGNFILEFFAKDFLDSADLFDESSPDVTAHVLEALATQGLNKDNSKIIKKAVDYLMTEANKDHEAIWFGRWGINYIYGTAASLLALAKVGVPPSELERPINWLLSVQNEDGGFGESSKSYLDRSLAGIGKSTPSQTAWALNALIANGYENSNSAKRAANYLIDNFEQNGKWVDLSPVGTGHPGLLDLNYPSYSYAFPLIALSHLFNKLN